MGCLELRIPPPVVGLLCAALAWLLAHYASGFDVALPGRLPAAALLILAGLALDAWSLLGFRRARTTISPLSPGKSTVIVQGGPYRFTRNPMYLGMAAILLGLCVLLANALGTIALVVFVAYITRFQILPEEQLLRAKFGEAYAQYARRVRRWL